MVGSKTLKFAKIPRISFRTLSRYCLQRTDKMLAKPINASRLAPRPQVRFALQDAFPLKSNTPGDVVRSFKIRIWLLRQPWPLFKLLDYFSVGDDCFIAWNNIIMLHPSMQLLSQRVDKEIDWACFKYILDDNYLRIQTGIVRQYPRDSKSRFGINSQHLKCI